MSWRREASVGFNIYIELTKNFYVNSREDLPHIIPFFDNDGISLSHEKSLMQIEAAYYDQDQ